MQSLETVIYELFENFKRNIKSAPLYLGGVSTYSGGAGGPAGGFIGQLPQSQVAYDFSEAATDYTPTSGYTLVDNLNHIRYKIQEMEDGSTVIMQGTDVVTSGITILKFDNAFELTPITDGVMITLISGISISGITNLGDSLFIQHVYNEIVTSTGTSHDTEKEFITGSLRVYLNGVRQDSTQFTEDADCHGFETAFSVPAGYKLEVEYAFAAYGDGSALVTAPLEVQKDGTTTNSNVTVINFEGDGVFVESTTSGVNILISGTGGDTFTGNHNSLSGLQGGISNEYYHLAQDQLYRVLYKSSESTDGYLSKEDYIKFNTMSGILSGDPVNAVSATRLTSQSVPTGYFEHIEFTGVLRNDGGMWDIANPERLYAINTGWHIVNIFVDWAKDATVTGKRQVWIRHCHDTSDGILYEYAHMGADIVGKGPTQSISTLAYLEAGDYIYFTVYQTSGDDLDITIATASMLLINQVVAGGSVEEAPIDGEQYARKDGGWTTISGGTTDHTTLSNIGTNTHAQIDIALSRLATTSGNNSGDQDLSDFIIDAPVDNEQYARKNAEWVVISGGTIDHTALSNIGTNTHDQIDIALNRLATTSGTNSGDQDLSSYLTDAPVDNEQYARKNSNWVVISGGSVGVEEAPVDEWIYGRQNSSWVVVSGITISGVADAPSDGSIYGRKDNTWTPVSITQYGTIVFGWNNGTSVITAQDQEIVLPFAGTITDWTIVSDKSANVSIDLWVDGYAEYPPTVLDTICNSNYVSLTTSDKNTDSTLTGWTKTFSAGDIMKAHIISVDTASRILLTIKYTKN